MKMAESTRESPPLHKAVEYKILHKIKILLPKAKDINEKNSKGYTPLLIACEQSGNEEILDALLQRKDIDITVTNNDKFTALHCLAFKGCLEGLVKVLEAFPEADIEAENDKGNTPLMMACKVNNLEIVKYLLERGVNVNHANSKKFTALHYAANNGYTQCTELLLKYGADVDAREGYDLTPLMRASKWSLIKICEILLNNGADVNAHSNHYVTALSWSCYNDCVELTKLMISRGAKVNFPGPYSSALITAAKLGSVECTKELLKSGVRVTARMRNQKNALRVAREKGQRDIVKLLASYE